MYLSNFLRVFLRVVFRSELKKKEQDQYLWYTVKPLKIQVYDNKRGNEYHTALRGAGHPAPGKTENDRE
jgi:hypothetical protein